MAESLGRLIAGFTAASAPWGDMSLMMPIVFGAVLA